MNTKRFPEALKIENHSHAWKDRPMNMDEDDLHPFTVARMTSHSVRGRFLVPAIATPMLPVSRFEKCEERWEADGGAIALPEVRNEN